jgi:hypothetical protein
VRPSVVQNQTYVVGLVLGLNFFPREPKRDTGGVVMRNFIIWTLTFLLGFEPALMAEGNARVNADLKAFLELSQIGKRPVTFRELYNKFSGYLPQAQRDELKLFIQNYGNLEIPKMDINKIRVAGQADEVYKLQVVQAGQSGTMEIMNSGKIFARINGQSLTGSDMNSTANVMQKAGLPRPALAAFKRVKLGPDLLSAKEILKLKKEDQKKYFKDFRELLASMEAVQNANFNIKSHAMLDSSDDKFSVIARLIRGEKAFADEEGMECVAAGYVTTAHRTNGGKGKLTCGSDGQDGIPLNLRERPNNQEPCGKNMFACNKDVYGEAGAICVPAGKNSTYDCNQNISKTNPKNDIPDLVGSDVKKFNELRDKARTAANEVARVCATTREQNPKEAAAPKRGKKAAKNPIQGLIDDQLQTCDNFDARLAVINSWDCEKNPQFKKDYKQLCEEKKQEEDVVGVIKDPPGTDAKPSTPQPQTPPTAPALQSCHDPNLKQYGLEPKCEGGSYGKPDDKNFQCLGPDGKPVPNDKIYECFCYDGKGSPVPPASKMKCGPGATSTGTNGKKGGDDDGIGGWFKKNKSWLVPLACGFIGLLVYHWLAKKSVQQNYQYLDPVTPNPPLPPPAPAPAAPVPRGAS